MFKKMADTVSRWKTIYQVMFPVAIGIMIILLSVGLGSTGAIGRQIGDFLLPLGLFVLGFMGLPMIIRQEVPWLITIRGWIAVVEGFLLLLIWWSLAIGAASFLLRMR